MFFLFSISYFQAPFLAAVKALTYRMIRGKSLLLHAAIRYERTTITFDLPQLVLIYLSHRKSHGLLVHGRAAEEPSPICVGTRDRRVIHTANVTKDPCGKVSKEWKARASDLLRLLETETKLFQRSSKSGYSRERRVQASNKAIRCGFSKNFWTTGVSWWRHYQCHRSCPGFGVKIRTTTGTLF